MSEEGSQQFYFENKDKIDLKDRSTWKYFPFGDPMRKGYDYHFKSLEFYAETYYREYPLDFWNSWMNEVVLPGYRGDIQQLQKKMGEGMKNVFDVQAMKSFYERHKTDNQFDDDILLFFAYLNGEGFFVRLNVSYEKWIRSTQFDLSERRDPNTDRYSLLEMSEVAYGMNLIRDKVTRLEWWKR
jgi:hypothetical protein